MKRTWRKYRGGKWHLLQKNGSHWTECQFAIGSGSRDCEKEHTGSLLPSSAFGFSQDKLCKTCLKKFDKEEWQP